VIAIAPEVAERTFCLDPKADIPDPAGQPIEVYRECAAGLRKLIRSRLNERRELHALPGVEFG
jgi:protein-tyrosine-phosphatase